MDVFYIIKFLKKRVMKQEFENGVQNAQVVQQYEAPAMEVLEIEIEGPILQMSGEDSGRRIW